MIAGEQQHVAPRPPKHPPVAVKVVAHRGRDGDGRRLAHVGYVQRRTPSRIERYGGKRWAAWARLTRDGVESGPLQRFDTFATEEAARRHAARAARNGEVHA